MQLVFDAWLLMASGRVSMVDARNAMLAADVMRFNSVNQDILWNAFAKRGLGQLASSNTTDDTDPVPSFESPHANEATLRFTPTGNAAGEEAQLFIGHYEARANPIADTDPATALSDTFKLVPGTYELLARGNGFGAVRTSVDGPGRSAARPADQHAGERRVREPTARRRPATGSGGPT